MEQERLAALQRAAGAASAGGPGVGPMPWDQPVDYQQVAQNAQQLAVEARHAQAERYAQEGVAFQPRAQHGLIEVDDDGEPLHSPHRAIDMTTSAGYGPESKEAIAVINEAFADQNCSEIHFNEPDKIFLKYKGERVNLNARFSSEAEYNRFVEDLVRQADTPHTWEDIKKEGRAVIRMAGGNRMLIWTPPIAENIHLAIHKVIARTWDMDYLVNNGTLTAAMANFLIAAVKAHANILICGELGAGKSVMLSLLAQHIAQNERIALIEEVPEVFMANPDVTRLTYNVKNGRGENVSLAGILDGSLYGRYDRVIIGELHDSGAYRMLRVMSTGGDGSLCTFHAGDSKSALEQVRNHVLLEYPQLPAETVSHFIRQAINVVVIVERIDGQHRVKEIAEVEWRNLANANQNIGVNRLYEWDRKGNHPANATGEPNHVAVGRLDQDGKIVQKAINYGVSMPREWFAAEAFQYRD